MNIAVLGCGPAGLMAAHAATVEGHEVDIISEKNKSRIGGAQYLHEPIEGITEEAPDFWLSYVKLGDGPIYAKKVYGHPLAPVSWDRFRAGEHSAWSMVAAYDRLWSLYGGLISDQHIDSQSVPEIAAEYDKVISAVPLPVICYNETHEFRSQEIFLEEVGQTNLDNTVIYSGRFSEPWYRTSNINGESWTEYTKESVQYSNEIVELGGAVIEGQKPLESTCDCHPGVARVGRFGRWEKGQLVHNAFKSAVHIVAAS